MKTLLSIGALLFALPILQTSSQTPAPSPQRGGTPAAARPAPLSAAECKCSIEVTVKHESNGAPISDVTVTVTLNSQAPTVATSTPVAPVAVTATSDTSGRVTFPNLAEGTYSINARREGFFGPSSSGYAAQQVFTSANVGPSANDVSAVISALTTSGFGTSISSVVKQPIQHVSIVMVEGGIVSGRIQDVNHRPAVGVPITPFQISYQNGQRILRQTGSQILTDDLGQYRLFWLAPGEYYLVNQVQPQQLVRGGGPNFPSPTYYPGTTDVSRARPIVVGEGQEISGTDFELQVGGGVTISGIVTNTLPGRVNPNGQMNRNVTGFFLVPRNSSLLEQPRSATNAATGARGARRGGNGVDETEFPFEIRGVPPGSYDFYPLFNDGATPRNNAYTGRVPIDVGSENISGIRATIQPGVDLKIRVSVIGTPPAGVGNRPAQPFSLQNMRVQLRPVDSIPPVLTNALNALVGAEEDGIIILANVPEARLFVSTIAGLPTDAYVSEMRQGSRSIMDDTIINIGRESPDPLEIVVGRSGGTIAGTLQDAQGKPVVGGRIFLIPDLPRRKNLTLYKSATSTAAGAFTVNGIAPGAYRLYAWDNIPQGAEQNEEFMSQYAVLGTRVVVSVGTPMSNIQVSQIKANR